MVQTGLLDGVTFEQSLENCEEQDISIPRGRTPEGLVKSKGPEGGM